MTRFAHAITWAGAAIALPASVFGCVRAFGMRGDMHSSGMSTMDGGSKLHGMPLAEMPEMFVAGFGIVVTIVGAALAGATARREDRGEPSGSRRRWLVAAVATAALTIDISKTSTLGFVLPGLRAEYGVGASTASLLAVGGLSGTATGALLFSRFAGRLGRRGSYLVATLGFAATSMCGGMPTFAGNVVMCYLMGIAVGGLAPLLITVLADLFPGHRRGPLVTGLSVVATAIGYLVAAGSALWLEPVYGWRVLWLIGAPTGLVLALVTSVIPERPHRAESADVPAVRVAARGVLHVRLQWLYAATIGVLTFGLTTWVPTLARAGGLSASAGNAVLTGVAVVMVPCAFLLLLAYRRLGPVPLAVRLAVCTAVSLLALVASGVAATLTVLSAMVLAAALFAVNTMASVFLPIAADLAEPHRRGRVTGTVSFFNRLGGLAGPLVLSLIVSSVTGVLVAVAALAIACGAIAWYTGRRHRELSTGPEIRTPEPSARS